MLNPEQLRHFPEEHPKQVRENGQQRLQGEQRGEDREVQSRVHSGTEGKVAEDQRTAGEAQSQRH